MNCVMSGGAISWLSKKQPVVALSTTEAEYHFGAAVQEVVWLRRLLSDSEDNQGTNCYCKKSSVSLPYKINTLALSITMFVRP